MPKNKKLTLALCGLFILIMPLALAKTSHFYKLNLYYENGTISSKSIEVKPLMKAEEQIYGDYSAEIVSLSNTILNRTYFDFPLEIYFDTIDETTGEINGGGIKILNESEITLLLPYYKDAKEIIIYGKDFKVLTIDVSDFSKTSLQHC